MTMIIVSIPYVALLQLLLLNNIPVWCDAFAVAFVQLGKTTTTTAAVTSTLTNQQPIRCPRRRRQRLCLFLQNQEDEEYIYDYVSASASVDVDPHVDPNVDSINDDSISTYLNDEHHLNVNVEELWQRQWIEAYEDLQDEQLHLKRSNLKQQLAQVAILEDYNYDYSNSNSDTIHNSNNSEGQGISSCCSAEELMKQLEVCNPTEFPAYHSSLNAQWSFVFTGVPTIGMRLITLLSRLSTLLPQPIKFHDVYLQVATKQRNSQQTVTAHVEACVLGQPFQLEVHTKLQKQRQQNQLEAGEGEGGGERHRSTIDDDDGTILSETFDKVVLNGFELPTPQHWKKSRQLQITYLDEDMMIARTAGGEPHFLLRHHRNCDEDDTDDNDDDEDEECTIPTDFLQQARQKYGATLSRSLVDREYTTSTSTSDDDMDTSNVVPVVPPVRAKDLHKQLQQIFSLVTDIAMGKNGHS